MTQSGRQSPFRRALHRGGIAAGVLFVLGMARPAFADDEPADAVQKASQQVATVTAGVNGIRSAVQKAQVQRTPEQQIADATLLLNSKDYDRAATFLNQIIEKYPDHPTAYPDAMTLLGETYYRSGQLWSARRAFKLIVDAGADPKFSSYQPKALARLVDIAMRKRDDQMLNEVIAAFDKLPANASALMSYARGKAQFARKDYVTAKQTLGTVGDASEYGHQARYLAALISVKEATPTVAPVLADGEEPPPAPPKRYAAAIDMFAKITQMPGNSEAHKQVIEAAWLAIGRLHYETGQLTQAIQAYNRIDRTSAEFGTMLYELAWTYVKLGDADRALRALEVLAIADPEGQNVADGTLLRGDLMLRAGKFDKALTTYEGFKATYDPMRDRMEAFLGSTSDPAVYYDKLVKKEFEALDGSGLPPMVVEWAREAEDGEAAFAIVDDVQECRELLEKSANLIERLTAVLNSPARVRAFPELKGAMERALGLINRTAMARLIIGQGMENADDDDLSGEIGAARAERRRLEARLKKLPVTENDFALREVDAQKQWNKVSQGVQRLELEVNHMNAITNGLRRVLTDGSSLGIVRDPASSADLQRGVDDNERDLALYRSQLEALRKMIGAGRIQAGFGDQRFIDDDQVRGQYKAALRREVELASQGAGGGDLAGFARRALPVLQQADSAEESVAKVKGDIDAEVERRTQGVVADVDKEQKNLVEYGVRLDELDQQARVVVGEVAMRNFGFVRDRLKTMVMRADVGITQQAWEVRQDQITRVQTLQRERAREERLLREELNEVLDDAGESSEEPQK